MEQSFSPSQPNKPLLETGSSHYRRGGIQPIEFIEANQIPFHEANVIKYVFRWKDKGGKQDLKKALWYLERLIEIAPEPESITTYLPVEGLSGGSWPDIRTER